MKIDIVGPARDPDLYFDRVTGLNAELLAMDVLSRGDLAVGIDKRFWSYTDGVWSATPEIVNTRCVHMLVGRYRPNLVSVIEGWLRAYLPRIECAPTPDLINFRNGMLDWCSGTLKPHHPEYYSTVQAPFDWDEHATCPRFDAFLASILTPDYVELAWEMIGYLMMSGNPLQVAFLFKGEGSNGKGTLMRVIESLLGIANCSNASLDSLNNNRFTAATLYGKIANLAGDIDASYQTTTAVFKTLTGEDAFQAENKGEGSFRFKSWAVPVFSANKVPGSADTSKGYLRRWIMLDFPNEFTNGNKILSYSDVLTSELAGIATKAMPALRTLMERGYFKLEGDAAAGMEEFAQSTDQVRQWVAEATDGMDDDRDVTYVESRVLLYASYKWWAEVNGVGKLKASEFYHRLRGAGFRSVKLNGERIFYGIKVTDYRALDIVSRIESRE